MMVSRTLYPSTWSREPTKPSSSLHGVDDINTIMLIKFVYTKSRFMVRIKKNQKPNNLELSNIVEDRRLQLI